MKQLRMALALGIVAMTANLAFAAESCTPIDGGTGHAGTVYRVGVPSVCINDDGWHFDFYTYGGRLFYDGLYTGMYLFFAP
jgi:hypothetical protein